MAGKSTRSLFKLVILQSSHGAPRSEERGYGGRDCEVAIALQTFPVLLAVKLEYNGQNSRLSKVIIRTLLSFGFTWLAPWNVSSSKPLPLSSASSRHHRSGFIKSWLGCRLFIHPGLHIHSILVSITLLSGRVRLNWWTGLNQDEI